VQRPFLHLQKEVTPGSSQGNLHAVLRDRLHLMLGNYKISLQAPRLLIVKKNIADYPLVNSAPPRRASTRSSAVMETTATNRVVKIEDRRKEEETRCKWAQKIREISQAEGESHTFTDTADTVLYAASAPAIVRRGEQPRMGPSRPWSAVSNSCRAF